jgi:hypothetical protein
MKTALLIFVIFRTFLQFLCDDYVTRSKTCVNLLQKATAETLPDIRSALFLKVIEADNVAFSEALENYNIYLMDFNTSYASEQEIVDHACKIPPALSSFLEWTAGVLPLLVVYFMYRIYLYLSSKCQRPLEVVQIQEAEIELTAPPKDTPPRNIPPRDRSRQEPKAEPRPGIRRRQVRVRQREQLSNNAGPSVLEKLKSLSPSLKNRIMSDDPIV